MSVVCGLKVTMCRIIGELDDYSNMLSGRKQECAVRHFNPPTFILLTFYYIEAIRLSAVAHMLHMAEGLFCVSSLAGIWILNLSIRHDLFHLRCGVGCGLYGFLST